MTDGERALWSWLRFEQIEGCKFRRQCPIGAYIVDFVCFDKMLIVEVDGGQHANRHVEDEQRTAWLERQGYRVIRFWNNQIFCEIEGVLESIRRELLGLDRPHPGLPPLGEGAQNVTAEPNTAAFTSPVGGGASRTPSTDGDI